MLWTVICLADSTEAKEEAVAAETAQGDHCSSASNEAEWAAFAP